MNIGKKKGNIEANIIITLQCQLLNGCEILVTTVPCLYRLMVNLSHMNLFSRERIVSFVIDNIDTVYEQFGREICEIHKSLCHATSNVQVSPKFFEMTKSINKTLSLFLKLIITSRTWLKRLETFYTESDRVTLCIGSYIEAAVYGKTEMTIELLGQEFKADKLICKWH